jgi:outer membrane protein
MRSMLRATAIALTCILAARAASAQGGAGKIVFVNSQSLMEAAPGRAAAEAVLNKEGETLRAQVQKLQDSINAHLAKYQKDEPTLSAAAKDKAQKALQGEETDLQATQLKLQQSWQARQTEVMAPITDLVKGVLDAVRTEEGYAMILDNAPGAGAGIVAADKNLDITDKVVSRLRATSPKPVAAPAAPKTGAPAAPAGVTKPTKPPTQ